MIDLSRDGDVFTLTMDAGENRWNTAFVREFAQALDAVEASSGPAALVTRSADAKFFSNGLDLDCLSASAPQRCIRIRPVDSRTMTTGRSAIG